MIHYIGMALLERLYWAGLLWRAILDVPYLLVYILIENGLPYMLTRNEYRAKARRSAKPNDNLNK